MTFDRDQLQAASSFVHTMIVVDDEPTDNPKSENIPATVNKPGRRHSATKVTSSLKKEIKAPLTHPLNTKELIKSALNLGLICSVVNPKGDENEVANSVAKAAKRADIISLDWHMGDHDNGELATEIIEQILIQDESVGGRLRLIAIYTGNKFKNKILNLVMKRINKNKKTKNKINLDNDALTNHLGLRIVWREKAMGRNNTGDTITEVELPKSLLTEFSKLSGGLLGNVALATIATLRDTTHHVLSKFNKDLDGPFFIIRLY